MTSFDQLYRPPSDACESLQPLLRKMYEALQDDPVSLAELKAEMLEVLKFLASPAGRTDANCRAVDFFLMKDEVWNADRLPEAFVEVLNDMSGALHDAVTAPEIAANFESTPELLLERTKKLKVL